MLSPVSLPTLSCHSRVGGIFIEEQWFPLNYLNVSHVSFLKWGFVFLLSVTRSTCSLPVDGELVEVQAGAHQLRRSTCATRLWHLLACTWIVQEF